MEADTYENASVAHRAATGKGLTRQTWALKKKLIEIDRWAKLPHRFQVVEVHPEVCFVAVPGPPRPASSPPRAAPARTLALGHAVEHPLERRDRATSRSLTPSHCRPAQPGHRGTGGQTSRSIAPEPAHTHPMINSTKQRSSSQPVHGSRLRARADR
jgi:hypothetical protein